MGSTVDELAERPRTGRKRVDMERLASGCSLLAGVSRSGWGVQFAMRHTFDEPGRWVSARGRRLEIDRCSYNKERVQKGVATTARQLDCATDSEWTRKDEKRRDGRESCETRERCSGVERRRDGETTRWSRRQCRGQDRTSNDRTSRTPRFARCALLTGPRPAFSVVLSSAYCASPIGGPGVQPLLAVSGACGGLRCVFVW